MAEHELQQLSTSEGPFAAHVSAVQPPVLAARKEGLPSASRNGTRKSMVGKLMPRYSTQVVYGLRAYGFSTSTWRMAVATAGSISAQAEAAFRRSCTSCRAGGMSRETC